MAGEDERLANRLQGIDSAEIIETVHSRPAPVISATAGLAGSPDPAASERSVDGPEPPCPREHVIRRACGDVPRGEQSRTGGASAKSRLSGGQAPGREH